MEVDNLPSQKYFEQLGAKLAGMCDSAVLKTDEEKKRFEERNLDLIDAHMVELAGRLGIDPRALLSHLLDYQLNISRLPRNTQSWRWNPYAETTGLSHAGSDSIPPCRGSREWRAP